MALPLRSACYNTAELQMLFWRIHSPAQQKKEERRQTSKRCESGNHFPKQTRRRCVLCGRTRHSAQTWRTGDLTLFVGHAFTAECSSAMWTSRCCFAQRMKQASSVAQTHRGRGWRIRSHSSVMHPRGKESQTLLRSSLGWGSQWFAAVRERPVAW